MNLYEEAAKKIEEGMETLGLEIDDNLRGWIDMRKKNPTRCTGKTTKMLVEVIHRALNSTQKYEKFCVHTSTRHSALYLRERMSSILDVLSVPHEDTKERITIKIPKMPIIYFGEKMRKDGQLCISFMNAQHFEDY